MQQSPSITTTLNSPTIDIEVSRMVPVLLASMCENGSFTEALPAKTRSRLQARNVVLRATLQPAKAEDIKQEIAKLMAAYPSLRGASPADALAMLHQFTEALKGVPLWALRGVCRDVLRGSIPGLNPDFPPTAPRVRQLVDIRDAAQHQEARDIERILTAKVVLPDDKEKAAAVIAGFKTLQQRLREPEKPSTFKAPTITELGEIYRNRSLPKPTEFNKIQDDGRNVTRNVERNVTPDADADVADHDGYVDDEYADHDRGGV